MGYSRWSVYLCSMEELLPYLIVCPLVFLAGFIDAIAGGGGLISLPAYLIAGLPPHAALGTNKFSSTMGTTVATLQYARNGFIHWRQVIVAVPATLIGAYIGSRLALVVPERTFLILMLFILPLTAAYILLRKKSLTGSETPYPPLKTALIITVLAFFIGVYDGFYGPGTGTFLMITLTGLAHVSLNDAAGITKTINLTSNITAFTVFLLNGVVWLQLGFVAALFSITGNYLGARYFTSKGTQIVRPAILLVLSIFFIKILNDLLS